MSNYQFKVSFLNIASAFDVLMNVSNFDKTHLTVVIIFSLTVSLFFFRVFFRFFFTIITDFEISFLSVSVKKITRKIFRVCFAFVEKIKFFGFFVVVVFFVMTSNEITMFNRNTEKRIQNEQNSSLKKSSNNVESSYSDVFSSSLSFDHSKSNDQKNLDSFDNFSIVDVN